MNCDYKIQKNHEFTAAGIPGLAVGIHGSAVGFPGQLFLDLLEISYVWYFTPISAF